jgi:glycosyltransferase involved in cell wall biosynthesis
MSDPNVLAGEETRGLEPPQPRLSVVVPVFNQAASIVANLGVIRERIGEELGNDFEIVVVSDGSIDATEAELLAQAPGGTFRVFHYDRNLGKGYAVKLGGLEARGKWIGFVDADLDLDPRDLATYVRRAEEASLDFAIGSKRHPDSEVSYPPSRVVASWMFQQFVRVFFRLNVRDTQVGLKVFRREVAEQVLPLLLVKRYAFDIELLAVARAFGFSRVEEMPVRLDYRFTGSGVRSRAVLRALIDTAAIFYRLRILRYYQRRRAISGAYGWSRPRVALPRVSVLLVEGARFRDYEYPNVEIIDVAEETFAEIRAAAERATGEVIAILEPRGSAAANWLSSTVPYFVRPEIAAVVVPRMAPLAGPARARAAAAVDESRIGAGLGYFRYTPGNIRYVKDFPAESVVIRREDFLALAPDVELEDVVAAVSDAGGRVLYTPDSVIVSVPPPLFGPHLRVVFGRGSSFGRSVRRGRVRRPGLRSSLMAIAMLAVIIGVVLAFGGVRADVLLGVALVYAVAVAIAALAAALRHQSLMVGVLTAGGIVCTHVVYSAGVIRGLISA